MVVEFWVRNGVVGYKRLHAWKWSEATPFPPIAYVHNATIYTDPQYEPLRIRLASPVPVPTVTSVDGKTYQTVDTVTRTNAEGSAEEKYEPFFILGGLYWRGNLNTYIS